MRHLRYVEKSSWHSIQSRQCRGSHHDAKHGEAVLQHASPRLLPDANRKDGSWSEGSELGELDVMLCLRLQAINVVARPSHDSSDCLDRQLSCSQSLLPTIVTDQFDP